MGSEFDFKEEWFRSLRLLAKMLGIIPDVVVWRKTFTRQAVQPSMFDEIYMPIPKIGDTLRIVRPPRYGKEK